MESIIAVFVGVLIRLAIPLAVTILVVYVLRRMDEHWKQEAQLSGTAAPMVRNIGCWEINQCAPENRASCAAYANPDKPCWQVFRQSDGRLREGCLACKIFQRSPVPIAAGD